ncbi:MAG: benzoylformate decarboxylase [Candidatus Eremiobacteraeota bacterium]|jgi:benzoylformate decarboxylase|nr:benzoylformate decarboxylase [Candidatus Eremiobacteraeota bacterium]
MPSTEEISSKRGKERYTAARILRADSVSWDTGFSPATFSGCAEESSITTIAGQAARTATVREVTIGLLRALGMTTVFGNPGSTELRFLADWPADFRYVLGLHEGCSVAMADAFAQLTRNAAFVNLHSAGGVGNAMGAIFTAYKNQAPLVIVAGQQTRAMLGSEPFLFAQDAAVLPRPYVKWSSEPARAEDVPAALARAYHIALERPYGPTFVSVPEDDWDRAAEPLAPRRVYADVGPDPAALAELAAAFDASTAPALVVGAGVDRDDAAELVVRLAERTGAPVWNGALASRCGFPEDHPLYQGALPRVRDGVVATLRGRDLVVVLGAPVFNYHVHAEGPFAPAAAVLFQLTDDPGAASFAVAGTSIITALRPALEALLPQLTAAQPVLPAPRPRPEAAAGEPISIAYLLQSLARTMPADAIVVEETPSSHGVLHEYLPLAPGRYFAAASGSLGYGLPAAVGAALAAPGRRVVGLIGDGSSYYGIQGLWTAAQQRLPIVYAIVNNGGYGAMKSFGDLMGSHRTPSFDIGGVDFVALARGFGCEGVRVERAADLVPALAAAMAARGPVLLDVAVDTAAQVLR